MGRYLQAIKKEVRNSLPAPLRREDRDNREYTPVEQYIEPPHSHQYTQQYNQGSGELSPQQLHALLQAAKAQGASEARENERDRQHEREMRHLDILQKAVEKQTSITFSRTIHGRQYNYGFGFLKHWWPILLLLLVGLVIWVSSMNPVPIMSGGHSHYERYERYDNR